MFASESGPSSSTPLSKRMELERETWRATNASLRYSFTSVYLKQNEIGTCAFISSKVCLLSRPLSSLPALWGRQKSFLKPKARPSSSQARPGCSPLSPRDGSYPFLPIHPSFLPSIVPSLFAPLTDADGRGRVDEFSSQILTTILVSALGCAPNPLY